MSIKLYLIVATCENMGIGINNTLPWNLKTELEYYHRMVSSRVDTSKKNIAILGRLSWESLSAAERALPIITFVLSRGGKVDASKYKDVYTFNTFESAVGALTTDRFKDAYEKVWVLGGTRVYKEGMESPHFYRLHLTSINKYFKCDTFMPPLKPNLKEVRDPNVPEGTQIENNITFVYKVYENPDYKP